ncbi:tRNA1(Val) (adenine(37)-N6)-methyltransferase [Denitrobaculum tricleocarpae]|uniref:Methyltransferase n=1 Tax=Denitrobaculum tricleocarpae TaxID=2591009 RepID=A0A545TXG1_9PROT|nr:methyltransferase [Denitrobaculum tricleocarpae]TQV81897.1 methyltransferase [Denitrobaculum tricleocarpae]
MSTAAPPPGGCAETADTTEDALLGGHIILQQPKDGYRAAIDPVFLAAAVAAKPGERILDLGSGVGAAALCLLRRVPDIEVTGLEIQSDLVELSRQNAAGNGLASRFEAIQGDVLSVLSLLPPDSFDHVICNPPYLASGAARPSPNPARTAANQEGDAQLTDWIEAAIALVHRKGSITFIHRADRIDTLIHGLSGPAGGFRVFPLWPKAGKAAKRILLQSRKAIASPAIVAPGLVLHRDGGQFTEAADAILRRGAALDLAGP